MLPDRARVWVTGHLGMLGSAMVRALSSDNICLLTTARSDLDLLNQNDVYKWVNNNQPEYIFHIAAKVGGIYANKTQPGDFIRENLLSALSVIDSAQKCNVKKLIFVASNCTYPKDASNPIDENSHYTGAFDENIRSYAISKIAGIELCKAYKKQFNCNFISVIPPNLYGPGDNYHPENGHVVAGIIRRAHEAKVGKSKIFTIWGDGTPRRELLHVDDLAEAMKFLMISETTHDVYNIGSGVDFSIYEISKMISQVVGFDGQIILDQTKPNGTMRKLLNSDRIRELGWSSRIDPYSGLKTAYDDFQMRYG